MRYYTIFGLLLILLVSACVQSAEKSTKNTDYEQLLDYGKPIAFGEDDLIHVFCAGANLEHLQEMLYASIERELKLVYPEKYFQIQIADIKEIETLNKYKNLVFIGDLSSTDRVSQYMSETLADDFIKRVEETGGEMFTAKNHWVRDQLVIYLLGKDADSLKKIAELQKDTLFSLLLDRYQNRLAYQAYLGKIIPTVFFKEYPYELKIPDSYRLFSNDKVGNFLSFIYRARMQNREIPDKYISIYYEDMPTDMVDDKWILEKRKEIGQKYFEGDIIEDSGISIQRHKFAGYDGWQIIGAWKNMKHMIGGSFQSQAFWHAETKRAYLVDNYVYFPAGQKLPSMLELYMISSGIKIK